jgi:hypothetical protein
LFLQSINTLLPATQTIISILFQPQLQERLVRLLKLLKSLGAMDVLDSKYHVPTGLTVVSGIFLLLGGIFGLVILGDIVWRRGWRSMMWIM